ncbi:helix-turn-helix transcriptional regulator [Alkalimarinus sediminis]|uniref:Helix-turn-helix transcriptional regulator n=1 Tax=Alkalimarinus sediminis TaxID=1632866 RepID=A0A9E8KIT9_9ALTE|nr:helix-turn-helix transcriptional regulator [Alkalimarinus sediminis]UZW74271.1 helix-turn-helix transcriptional regulator [Alkalimarinus sediminis]
MGVKTSDFSMSSAVQLTPFIQFFEDLGAPWEKGLIRQKLPTDFQETFYVPSLSVVTFVNDMAKREGIEDIGVQLESRHSQGILHPLLRQRLADASSLFSAIQAACEYSSLQGSHLHIWIQYCDDSLWLCHRGSISASIPGVEQFERNRLIRILELVRRFLGQKWQPAFLYIESRLDLTSKIRELIGGCDVRLGCPFGVVPIPLDDFAIDLWKNRTSALPPQTPHQNWLARVQSVLPTYVGQQHLNVDFVAELLCMSTRSLQRALAERGTTIKALIDDAKFGYIRAMMMETDLPIKEIARLSGFTDESNFTRFFRRMAGCSPTRLRDNGAK